MKKHLKEYFKLLKFARSYIKTLAVAALCMGASTIFEGITLGMMGPLTDRVFTNKPIVIPGQLPQFLADIVEKLNSIEPAVFFKYMVVFLPILFLVKGIFIFLQGYLMNVVGEGVVKDVRNKLYAKLQDLSLDFYGKQRVGELMSRVTNDVAIITNAISYALRDFIFESMKLVFFVFMALWIGFQISWKLPLVIFFIFPPIIIPVARIGKRVKKFSVEVQKKIADLNSQMQETIQGAHIVKAFCRESYEMERFKNINQDYYKFTLKSTKRILLLSPLTEFFGIAGGIAVMCIISSELLAGKLSFGVFATFLIFLLSMIRPLKKLANVHAINQKALAASARIYEILEQKPTIKDAGEAKGLKQLRAQIAFKGISFEYNQEDGYVLEDINLEVKKGEVLALVGHSGAGKTTLVGLLPRFYDPQKGTICIDSLNIKEVKLKDLRSLISIVSQETVLFNTTLRDNIAYGKEGASSSEIIKAAKKAHAYEFIMKLPENFNTIVGDRGFRLSGGQKQRIAIARAILKDAPILILDEATSHLDSVSEQLIKDALYVLMEGKTSFVIAHRLSTIQKADRIAVLDKGRIAEVGTHQQLLKANSLYKKFYDLQFSE